MARKGDTIATRYVGSPDIIRPGNPTDESLIAWLGGQGPTSVPIISGTIRLIPGSDNQDLTWYVKRRSDHLIISQDTVSVTPGLASPVSIPFYCIDPLPTSPTTGDLYTVGVIGAQGPPLPVQNGSLVSIDWSIETGVKV